MLYLYIVLDFTLVCNVSWPSPFFYRILFIPPAFSYLAGPVLYPFVLALSDIALNILYPVLSSTSLRLRSEIRMRSNLFLLFLATLLRLASSSHILLVASSDSDALLMTRTVPAALFKFGVLLMARAAPKKKASTTNLHENSHSTPSKGSGGGSYSWSQMQNLGKSSKGSHNSDNYAHHALSMR